MILIIRQAYPIAMVDLQAHGHSLQFAVEAELNFEEFSLRMHKTVQINLFSAVLHIKLSTLAVDTGLEIFYAVCYEARSHFLIY